MDQNIARASQHGPARSSLNDEVIASTRRDRGVGASGAAVIEQDGSERIAVALHINRSRTASDKTIASARGESSSERVAGIEGEASAAAATPCREVPRTAVHRERASSCQATDGEPKAAARAAARIV